MSKTKQIYDSIVVGLGGSGSSALYHLSRSGRKVLGLEKYDIPHNKGSSHGDSRIIRQAYFEGEYYVPFAKRSYEIWDKLEKESSTELFNKVGILNMGTHESQIVEKCKFAADKHSLSYELMNNKQVKEKFPFFNISDNYYALYEKNAGYLRPEKCVETFIKYAKADVKTNTDVKSIKYENKVYEVKTNGESYFSKELVLSCGPWINDILKSFGVTVDLSIDLCKVWYYDLPVNFAEFPVYLLSYGEHEIYGFPNLNNGNGFKISIYHQNNNFKNYDEMNREVANEKNERILEHCINTYFTKHFQNKKLNKLMTCIYTTTKDKDFIIDNIPGHENAILVSACSGHGFKFTPAIGEETLNLLDKKKKPEEYFSLSRFKII
jgi:monomeric sarcosine oxidase